MEMMKTERLLLRPFTARDREDLYEYLSDPQVVAFEPEMRLTRGMLDTDLGWRIGCPEMVAVECKAEDKLIGNVYLGKREYASMELGITFNRRYWGMGYAQEACEALIRRSFSEGVHRIYAQCDPENLACRSLLTRLGFRQEGILRENRITVDADGMKEWRDTCLYAIVNQNQ